MFLTVFKAVCAAWCQLLQVSPLGWFTQIGSKIQFLRKTSANQPALLSYLNTSCYLGCSRCKVLLLLLHSTFTLHLAVPSYYIQSTSSSQFTQCTNTLDLPLSNIRNEKEISIAGLNKSVGYFYSLLSFQKVHYIKMN